MIGDNFGDSTRLSINVIDLDATTDNTRSCADLERESYETLRCKLGESGSPGKCLRKNISVSVGEYTSNERRICFLGVDRVSDRAVSEGSSMKFDLKLAGEPRTEFVAIMLGSSSSTCQIDPTEVVFSSDNWTVPVEVKVMAVENDIDEGVDVTDECIINMTRSDVDQTPQTFRVTVLNDDTAGMNFLIDGRYRSRVYALTLMEGSETSVAIVLESEPRGIVNATCVVVSPANTTLHSAVVPSFLMFNSSAWKVPRELAVAVVEDDVDDESGADGAVFRVECHFSSTDVEYNKGAEIAMILRALDNDERGIETSTTFLSIIEGGKKEFLVNGLLSEPLHDVTLLLKSSSQLNLSPRNISIRAEEWKHISHAIMVTVPMGTGGGTHEVVIASESRDPNYDIDNLGKINVIVNSIDGNFASVADMTLQEGRASSFVLSLASRPRTATEIVTAALNSSSPLCQISPTLVRFALSNWTSTQSIEIFAVDNSIDEGDDVQGKCTISMARVGAEQEAETFQVTIINDDAADVTFEIDNEYQSKLYALTMTEGSEESVKVVVESEPRAAVSMACSALSPEDTQLRVMVIPSRMTFDSSNWTVRETLTVRVMDDEIDDESGDEAVFRIECHFLSADVEYNNTATNAILLRALDNDERGIQTSASFLSIIEGGKKEFLVNGLLSQPLHDVTLILKGSSDVSISPDHVTIKAGQWRNVTQSITVHVQEGAGGGTREIKVKGESLDSKYNEQRLGKIDVIVNAVVRPPSFERITTNGTHVHVTWNSTDNDCTEILEYSNSEFVGFTRLSDDGIVNQSGWTIPLYFQSLCEESKTQIVVKSKAWQTAEACLHSEEYLQVYADEFHQRKPLALYSTDASEATTECKTCPSGAVCKADTIGTLASLQPQEGFVRVEQKYSKAFGMSEKCIGECSDGKCAESYAGPLCGHCAEGATVSIGRTCAQCPSHGVFVVQVLLGMVIVGAAAAYLIYDGIVGASEIESKGVLPFTRSLCAP